MLWNLQNPETVAIIHSPIFFFMQMLMVSLSVYLNCPLTSAIPLTTKLEKNHLQTVPFAFPVKYLVNFHRLTFRKLNSINGNSIVARLC